MLDLPALLLKEGVIGEETCNGLETVAQRSGRSFREILLSKGIVSELKLLKLIAGTLGYGHSEAIYDLEVADKFLEIVSEGHPFLSVITTLIVPGGMLIRMLSLEPFIPPPIQL